MTRKPEPADVDRAQRQEFCRRVLENLSDVIDGEAPEDFCREVERVLGECRPYLAFRSTLEETIRLTREVGESERARAVDEGLFLRCVEKARARLDGDPSA